MEALTFFLIAAALGAASTSIGCRHARTRGRRPSWNLVLVGMVATALSAMLYIGRGDIFHPERWDTYKGGFWPPVILASTSAAVVALLASLAAVCYFRARFKDENTMT